MTWRAVGYIAAASVLGLMLHFGWALVDQALR